MGLLGRLFKKGPVRNKEAGSALKRYAKSFFHALEGFVYCVRYEHNMIIIITAAILVTIFGFFFHISVGEWLFVISMIGAVTACEMINSSIEAAVDLTTSEIKPLAKIAKDAASSATLILSITSFIGALIIFIPKIQEYILEIM